ncbi:hypothetical protein [Terricaulis sp.]|uniref:hypothetical protein n=1 Tax=Terricaulis sp. TaxID=2768686 RepID=UPI002AC64952|nr:hypothetical protein [Terricaulis sp.]MDZ4693428.1 hypothetical protein [Terricaulis sp.]
MPQKLASKGYEILFTSHADAILGVHVPNEGQNSSPRPMWRCLIFVTPQQLATCWT